MFLDGPLWDRRFISKSHSVCTKSFTLCLLTKKTILLNTSMYKRMDQTTSLFPSVDAQDRPSFLLAVLCCECVSRCSPDLFPKFNPFSPPMSTEAGAGRLSSIIESLRSKDAPPSSPGLPKSAYLIPIAGFYFSGT